MKRLEEEKLYHLVCYKCNLMGPIAKFCPTKKPQVEPKSNPQVQVKNNHEDGVDGEKTRTQDREVEGQDQKQDLTQFKHHSSDKLGYLDSECLNKLVKKAQVAN
jgi:hypothetical protein